MELNLIELVKGSELFSDCKSLFNSRSGSLVTDDYGILFKSLKGDVAYGWDQISKLNVLAQPGKKPRYVITIVTKDRSTHAYESKSTTPNEIDLVLKIQNFEDRRSELEIQANLSSYKTNGLYLGGLRGHSTRISGELTVNLLGIFIADELLIGWENISSIDFTNEKADPHLASDLFAFGIAGAVLKMGQMQTSIALTTKNGEVAYITSPEQSTQSVRAGFSRVMADGQIVLSGLNEIKTTSTDDIVSQLEKLSSLRDSGVLSEEEFQIAKQKLLA